MSDSESDSDDERLKKQPRADDPQAVEELRRQRRQAVKAAAETARAKAKKPSTKRKQRRVEEFLAAKKQRRQKLARQDKEACLRKARQDRQFKSFPYEKDHIEEATMQNYKAGPKAYQKFFLQRDGVRWADITAEGIRTFFRETTCHKPPTLDKYARGLQWHLYHQWERLKTEKKDTARRRQEDQLDKHDELTDHLSPEDWELFNKTQLENASLSKEELRGTGITAVGSLQAWADNLALFSCIIRSKTTREMQWSDQAARIEPMVEVNIAHNENGRIEIHSVLRHKNPLFDSRFARSCHLFYLWEKKRKKILKAGDKSWQREMISPGSKNPLKGRCAATQARYIRSVQNRLSIRSRKVTHFGRKQGIKWLMKSGIPMADVQKAAKFAQQMNKHFNMSYADDTPLTVQVAMAGFPEEARVSNFSDGYRIPREHAKVDEKAVQELLKDLCPWIDREYNKAKKRNERARLKAGRDLTEEGVLRFLQESKRLFLEDAAYMQDEFPDLPIYELKVFQSPHWDSFKKAILAAEADPESFLPPRKDLPSRILEVVSILSNELAAVKEAVHNVGGQVQRGAAGSAYRLSAFVS
ncbi:hypothetical protein KFL_000670390 [Klebsormidium nitens]|uniref:Ndc10 domain-containing protein n=1 Tax=Klebsormidium nitens TaxID=105231 RepID=A0A1Y1HT32_KLENI|nr:hypothetical protein KFL_000670390 [Klebsormidium nitens]|eukprot:GAQ80982.1 hypothetical protein KFL_000670390 [Klebsormidium nitens]